MHLRFWAFRQWLVFILTILLYRRHALILSIMNFYVGTCVCWSLWLADFFPSGVDDACWVWTSDANQLVAIYYIHWALICILYTRVPSLSAFIAFESGGMVGCSVSWDSVVLSVFHFFEGVEVVQAVLVEVIVSHLSWILADHLVAMTLIFQQRHLWMWWVLAPVVAIPLKLKILAAISSLASWCRCWALLVDGWRDVTSWDASGILDLLPLHLSLIRIVCHHISYLHRRIRSVISLPHHVIFMNISSAHFLRCASRPTKCSVDPNSWSFGETSVCHCRMWITFACTRSSPLAAVHRGDASEILLALINFVKKWVSTVLLMVAHRRPMEDVVLVALGCELATLGWKLALMA